MAAQNSVTKAAIQNVRSMMSRLAEEPAAMATILPSGLRSISTAASKKRSVTGDISLLMACQ